MDTLEIIVTSFALPEQLTHVAFIDNRHVKNCSHLHFSHSLSASAQSPHWHYSDCRRRRRRSASAHHHHFTPPNRSLTTRRSFRTTTACRERVDAHSAQPVAQPTKACLTSSHHHHFGQLTSPRSQHDARSSSRKPLHLITAARTRGERCTDLLRREWPPTGFA